jgi:hypothetical protein
MEDDTKKRLKEEGEEEEPPRRLKRLRKTSEIVKMDEAAFKAMCSGGPISTPARSFNGLIRIAVCGTINSGKCNLINLLLGRELLPGDSQGTPISAHRVEIDCAPASGQECDVFVIAHDGPRTNVFHQCSVDKTRQLLSDEAVVWPEASSVLLRTELKDPLKHITKFPSVNMTSTDPASVARQIGAGGYDLIILTLSRSNHVQDMMGRDFLYHLTNSVPNLGSKLMLVLSETQDPLTNSPPMILPSIKKWFEVTFDGAEGSQVLVMPFGAHPQHQAVDAIWKAINDTLIPDLE